MRISARVPTSLRCRESFVRSLNTASVVAQPWGQLRWLIGSAELPGSEQTFGVVTIHPEQRNPLHSHPNCEEILYVVSGQCMHRLGEAMIPLSPGDAICIPRGVRHWARCTSDQPLVAIISFSSPDRRADNHEDAGDA